MFENASSSSLTVSGVVLWGKAIHIAKRLQIDNVGATDGWIDCFKQKQSRTQKCMCERAARVLVSMQKLLMSGNKDRYYNC
jgi:hypothetical protein